MSLSDGCDFSVLTDDLTANVERRSQTEVRLVFPTMTVVLKDERGVSEERVRRVSRAARGPIDKALPRRKP